MAVQGSLEDQEERQALVGTTSLHTHSSVAVITAPMSQFAPNQASVTSDLGEPAAQKLAVRSTGPSTEVALLTSPTHVSIEVKCGAEPASTSGASSDKPEPKAQAQSQRSGRELWGIVREAVQEGRVKALIHHKTYR